jgi:hypothetical protein
VKIAITGHTVGLGLAMYKTLSKNHTITGYSKSTGFDLADCVDRLVPLIVDSDIFINNAYHPTGQTELLKRMYAEWRDQPKLIINIGSSSAHNKKFLRPEVSHLYVTAKIEQRRFIDQECNIDLEPFVCNFTPGLIDTPRVEYVKGRKLDPNSLANMVENVIQLHQQGITVNQLVITPNRIKQ